MEKLQKKMKINTCYGELKENNVYSIKKNSTKILAKSRNSQVSLTQSLFPSKKNSLKNITNHNHIGISDFCQTISSGFGLEWSRPESKHASRRQSNRPETSKGPRPNCSDFFGQGRAKCLMDSEVLKSPIPSKSMHQQAIRLKEREEEAEKEQGFQSSNFNNIRIVVTRSEKPRKEKSIYNDKFQTNLPDDFLSLFAD